MTYFTFPCRSCRRGRVGALASFTLGFFGRSCEDCDGEGEHRVFVSAVAHERDSIVRAVDRLLEQR